MSSKVNKKAAVEMNKLVNDAVFGSDSKDKQQLIRKMADEHGIFPASIQTLYDLIGKGEYHGFTVPAINIRGLSYLTARAVFRAALKGKVGPLLFELARSEMDYTKQSPGEFSACVFAAALAEGFTGPVYIQGDHFQIKAKNYEADSNKELDAVRALIKDSIDAGFYNIDIDASTLVNIKRATLAEQQEVNGSVTAEMTKYIRAIQPKKVTISIGGEIGEIGTSNSTPADLHAFMGQYRKNLGQGVKGISKISVQTGTTHGGVVLPDGSIAKVELDFNTLEMLSKLAREEYNMGGAVQHGASTLPDEMFDIFPRIGTLEVHLATGFQNIVFDSVHFPKDLLQKVYAGLSSKYAADKKSTETDAQFYYRNRKRSFGDFKKELWGIPQENLQKIGDELETRFSMLFRKLNVVNTEEIIAKLMKKP